jgi:hypothetical protein
LVYHIDWNVGQMWIEEKNCYLCEDERSNLNIMSTTLKSIVSSEVLGLGDSFQGIIFGHAFFKSCQCATTYEKFAKTRNMCLSSLHNGICKSVLVSPKKLGKGQ